MTVATHPTIVRPSPEMDRESDAGPPSDSGSGKRHLPLLPVAALLESQQTLTAVERFARLAETPDAPLQSKYYRDLLPLERPRPGQQYAFEVDLDVCTGCKACVVACHNLNGLDDGELWRSVGLLHGGDSQTAALQTVTTSCHHCVEPACMAGCPTQAYEKDPITGIVKHLDDQCFGCQYCTLMCPYDAPKYNEARGIVRKCDMCSDRLLHGQAPACVQACPNEAIAIRVIDQAAVVQAGDARHFLPGAPAPDHTLPTTNYKSARRMPPNMLPADFYTTRPEHSHPPLVIMLTLTQLSVGAFGLGAWVERLSGTSLGSPRVQALVACSLALLALGASVFHLGRPTLAWRAILGLRTSWLSREALAFGVFAKLAVLYACLVALPMLPAFSALSWLPMGSTITGATPGLQVAATCAGLFGVFCSVMVYVATRREQWSGTQTGVKFFGTSVVLGGATVFSLDALTSPGLGRAATELLSLLMATSTLKLLFEARTLWHHRDRQQSAFKRMAVVMLGDLRSVTLSRFALGLLGGVLLPFILVNAELSEPIATLFVVGVLASLLGGEFLERYLFFRAAPASRMPGGLR